MRSSCSCSSGGGEPPSRSTSVDDRVARALAQLLAVDSRRRSSVVCAVNGTNSACSVDMSCSRIPYCLASTTIERPSGVSSASEDSCADFGQLGLGHAGHRDELRREAVADRDRAGLVEQQHVHVAGGLHGAAGEREHVAAHRAGPCPAIPIADSSAPIVVGISATSSAISVVSEMAVPANRPNGRSVATTITKISVSAASRMFSAISLGVLRRSAPSTSAIMRSRNEWPGSWVISTTIRSDVTRVPPVTALRSPPDSRITGADSPVIADSSTVAMPSITVPSPGISSPAGHDHDVAADELGGGLGASRRPSSRPSPCASTAACRPARGRDPRRTPRPCSRR